MPFAISLITFYCYSLFIIASFIRFTLPIIRILSIIESTISTILFHITYLHAVCRDPGYLPFNWDSDEPRTKYSWRELMSGTAIDENQQRFVHYSRYPPGCSFSKTYGRFVIQADHVCVWIANWVGKRNHKHFLLMMVWGAIASVSLFGWRFAPRKSFEGVKGIFVLDIIAAVIEGIFALTLIGSFVEFMGEAMSGETRVDRFNGRLKRRILTKMEALRLICGDGSVWCWSCPIDAFPDEIELLQ
jgi:hypothetical protein